MLMQLALQKLHGKLVILLLRKCSINYILFLPRAAINIFS